ncbi:MAG: TIGR02206 family membrane protein [Pirellulales bacterium]
MPAWLEPDTRFYVFGTSHVVVLGAVAVLAGALVWLGRRVRGTSNEQRVRRVFAIAIVGLESSCQLTSMLPSNFRLDESLPFHLCDLAWVAAAYALWTRTAWAYGLVYYWGLSLTVQGLATPHLENEFPHWQFVLFFTGHSLTVLAAVFLTWGEGMRPSWRLWRLSILITVAWGAAMLVFNYLAGTNYLYVLAKPPTASAFDLMGPWPIYLFVSLAVGASLWALMTLPWYARFASSRTSDFVPATHAGQLPDLATAVHDAP